MLKTLKINQFVIIDTLELGLQPGLTILTGETGAGKSILLDAMGLILGERFNPESIRTGSDQSRIEALFGLSPDHPLWGFLARHGVTPLAGHELNIQRVIKRDGSNEIMVNGKAIDVAALKEIGTYLVEIHGQFANQGLMESESQLTLLDLSGGFPPEVFRNVADALREVRTLERELEEEKNFITEHQRDLPKIEEMVGRFDKIGMRQGFIEEAVAEHARLRTAKETSETFQSILGRLIAANGVVVALSAANQILGRQQNLDKDKMVKLSTHLSESLNHARYAVAEMNKLVPEYEIDTGPLQKYEQILAVLNTISKETKTPFEDLGNYYAVLSDTMQRVRNGKQKLAEINDRLIEAKNKYRHHAQILTEKRIAAGEALSQAITAEFEPLKLNKAEFRVKVEEKINMPWTERGINEVTFMGRMNPGMPFSPISETASGGELARMMLALKVVVQRVQTIPTLVFDEVDTGIGGAAAAAVGERLALLADTTQVLVITHSAQVAARGQQHLHVSKKSDAASTTSVVRTLSIQERTDEISRMLAGEEITSESQAAAKRLIDEASAAYTRRRAAS